MKSSTSYIILTALALIFVTAESFQCSSAKHAQMLSPRSVDSEYIVKVLSADSLEGRGTGTEGERKAAAFIVEQFQHLRLIPKGDHNTWYQTFSFTPHPPVQLHQVGDSVKMGMGLVKEIVGKNVLAYLDNGASQTIVIGAHYDHLGFGDENSLFTGGKAIHNGADDNASGVAVMIELAEKISKSKLKNNNYLFIGFSGEEKGLWGSNFFCKNPTVANMNYMINLDMVGRLNNERSLAISGVGTAPEWKSVLESNNTSKFSLVLTESGVGPSDHTSFYNTGIPAIHLFTGQHSDYHKPSDDADKINFSGIHDIADYLFRVISDLNNNGKLVFQKTKDESTSTAADFKVTLGVMPDYLYSGEGMRIDGVKEDRPASKAGLKQGDIIKKIGDIEVKDMMSYMEALSKFEKGQKTTIIYVRDGIEQSTEVTW